MRWILLVALVVVSCKSKSASDKGGASSSSSSGAAESSSAKGGVSKFTLVEAGDDTNKVNVEMAVPSSWKVDDSIKGGPSWKLDGARMLSLVTISTGGHDAATRLDKAIKMQDLADGARTDYPDGRAWVTKQDGANVHSRMFIPYAGGVVMGVSLLADKSKLDGVKAAFETLKVVP